MDRLGIDIGSKTIKMALLSGEDGSLLYSSYIRHFSKIKDKLESAVRDILWKLGDREVEVTVTGSAGMRVAELFDVPFVQEVVALKRAVAEYEPGTDVVLEMGGEDTKLVYLTGVPEQRMNTICAGGTGGFIDMMAGLMGKRNEDMQALAEGATTIYPIASRCAVFAKSDVRPLLNAGARKEDIAASVLEAVATQAVAGLSAGRPIKGRVLLLGGPFQYTPALRDAFCHVTGIAPEDAVVPENAHLFVVRGAALSPEHSAPVTLSEFGRVVAAADFSSRDGISRLKPLFDSQEEYLEFRRRHDRVRVPRTHLIDSTENLFLGIDAGSTTMKMALIDETGALVAYEYDWNEGDVTVSFNWMLKEIYRQLNGAWIPEKTIRRSCIVGYGEEFCQAAYGVDDGEVETVAHLRAATALEPDVDFLMDIGGQDIKCFYVKDGMIDDIVLNEACSSGCGSLFDDIARSMRRTKEGFAKDALFAKGPVDLGTRCSTFMDSRVKHAQKEGATQGDIAAGIAYSTARNALFKVVRQPDFSKVGEHVVVQGGAFANDAILRAFELETGTQVTRPDLAQLMGAWGAALLARDKWLTLKARDSRAAEAQTSGIIGPDELGRMHIEKTTARCESCGNKCKLLVTRFSQGWDGEGLRTYVTGNRCERGALAQDDDRKRKAPAPPNMIKLKNALIESYDRGEQPGGRVAGVGAADDAARGPVVGIPKALALYESYPFWKTFFNELGHPVLACSKTDEELYRKGMGSIPSEGECYPAKLAHGHAVDLAERGADVLFLPYMGLAYARAGLLGRDLPAEMRDCPLIEQMPDMICGNAADTALEHVRFACPDLLGCRSLDDAAGPLQRALVDAGLEHSLPEVTDALHAASEEYARFFAKLQKKNDEVLARVDAGEFPGALVCEHPYHADPGINHGVDGLLGDLGYAVLEQVDYRFWRHGVQDDFAWTPNRDLFYSAAVSAAHPRLQFIICRSFGCGIDAVNADKVHDDLRRQGRIYAELKLDQIVDLAAVRIRLRSLSYATKQRSGEVVTQGIGEGEDTEKLARGGARGRGEFRVGEAHLGNVGVPGVPGVATGGGASGAAGAAAAPVPARKVDARKVGEYYHADLGEHPEEKRQMAELGYRFVVDRVSHIQYLALFSYIIFEGPNGAVYFKTWEAVQQFVACGADESARIEGFRAPDDIPAESAIKPTDPRNAPRLR